MNPLYQLRLLFTAVQFFTRVPVPAWVGFEPAWLNRCVRYLPAIGLGVGAVGAAVFWGASAVWSPAVASVFSIVATVLTTGAFHEDGFADVCDGLGGTQDRDRALAIMTDSRVGAFGAIGIALLLLLKAATLAQFAAGPGALLTVLAHVVSRLAPLLLMAALPYVRARSTGLAGGGLGAAKAKPVAQGVTLHDVLAGIVVAALCGLLTLFVATLLFDDAPGLAEAAGWGGAAALVSAVPAGAWFRQRLGGITGDCLGAAQQISEMAFLLAASAALNAA